MSSFRLRAGSDGCTDSTLAPLKHRITGSKSRRVSYGGLARKLMLIAFEAPPISIVVPSGAERITYSDAMLVIAPGRFSMMICCFRIGATLSMSARVTKSVLPPGANGLTMRTILPEVGPAPVEGVCAMEHGEYTQAPMTAIAASRFIN